ncbi:MAG: GFA family protein [Alphaproteobacteria bacterium]|nr:GFA family protein [Alphaproteobacteria bacterium]
MTKSRDLRRSGKCYCGAVKFTAALRNLDMHVCHCSACRRWGGGGPAMSLDCESLVIEDPDKVTWFESSKWGERGFCNVCGSSLFFRLKDGSYTNCSVSALDDTEGVRIRDHIFVDFKPPYYEFADDAPRLTEEEFLAAFEVVQDTDAR